MLIRLATFSESLISTILFFIIFFKLASSYRDGFVGGSRANPYNSAPRRCNQIVNQEPLNPVHPVIRIFLLIKNDY